MIYIADFIVSFGEYLFNSLYPKSVLKYIIIFLFNNIEAKEIPKSPANI